jgi:hypothetical protein
MSYNILGITGCTNAAITLFCFFSDVDYNSASDIVSVICCQIEDLILMLSKLLDYSVGVFFLIFFSAISSII